MLEVAAEDCLSQQVRKRRTTPYSWVLLMLKLTHAGGGGCCRVACIAMRRLKFTGLSFMLPLQEVNSILTAVVQVRMLGLPWLAAHEQQHWCSGAEVRSCAAVPFAT